MVKSSLNWLSGLFDRLYEKEGYRGKNNPKGLSELHVSREDMEGWRERIIE